MNKLSICLVALSVVLSFGCEQKNSLNTTFVEGVVTLDGVPLAECNVNFSSKSSDGTSGGGLTDAKGHYTVTTGSAIPGSGLLPGEYGVSCSKVVIEGQNLSFEEYHAKYGNAQPKSIDIVPANYNSSATSGLGPVVVEKGKKNKFDFQLKSK
ncbi:MAG: hypothetical protein ACRC46_08585 [Thermoguttaceae bacterium]